MDSESFVEAVSEARATELHRLGSDKYLVAATGADLAEGPVLESVAREAATGQETFESWATQESGAAAEVFAAAAETEAAHLDRLRTRLDAETDGSDDSGESDTGEDDSGADGVSEALEATETTVERAGALVGRGKVRDRTLLQVVNFFVNEGDNAGADLARELRIDANDQVSAGADLLETVCESDDDWKVAQESAERVVGAAYGEYVAALEAMGVDPKPVC
jgi:hypothetical protein